MSSNSTTGQTWVSESPLNVERIAQVPSFRTRFDVERQFLHARVDALERELARERRRRQQVVDHYERVLEGQRREHEKQRRANEEQRRDDENNDGVLDWLW